VRREALALTHARRYIEVNNMHNMQQVLLVAALASADPRTVKRFFDGGTTRPSIAARIEHALTHLGLPSPRTSSPAPEQITRTG
jgi:hypothetical protein